MSPLFAATFLLLSAAVSGRDQQSSSSVQWAKRQLSSVPKKETVINLQFYFHDIVTGKNPTAVRVAQAAGTDKSPTLFGAILMADDPLTETEDPNSKLIGRAQGFYGSASQNGLALIMGLSYSFVDGPYNGSSLSVVGINPALNPDRELPVVGGTGVFRMARGYALLKTISLTPGGDAVVHYNVTEVMWNY
ncbi:Dirigent protein 23 [Linum perenne]